MTAHHTCPSSTFTGAPPRSVTFAKQATVRCMLHIRDYTEAQRRAAFYNAKEMRAINAENKETLRKMMKHTGIIDHEACSSSDNFCTRGLERHLREASKLRNAHKQTVISAVLVAQQEQHMMTMFDEEDEMMGHDDDADMMTMSADESIALMCSSLSGPSKVSAYLMGLADAEAAVRQFEGEEDHSKTSNMQEHPQHQHKQPEENSACRRMITMMRMRKESNPTYGSSSVHRQIVNSAA
eukprot:CAMPEP_0117024346 /NCGR_PEP_ID=MMETSP0472-20121206/18094_1 /TAXON_ID=693140 ORGANISM="Tiarina fusus, Strain LIS" /NCGR_SAMPLE_ID=MMETSP0472 /ASSEMBLY_ACC=CAM_ASM_000603 /LENGTH=238 /DNA_ID=CAMNT_0004730759 /DNA_START=82 /DNA_END=798 /DNA_ORIENTATION=-